MAKVKVILHKQIMFVENGKWFRFKPAEDRIKYSLIPASVYNDLKDAKPPVFSLADEIEVDEGLVEVARQDGSGKTIGATDTQNLPPVDAIEFADGDAIGDEDEQIHGGDDYKANVIKELTIIDGIGAATAEALYEDGIHSVEEIAASGRDELIPIKGISENNVDDIIESAKGL